MDFEKLYEIVEPLYNEEEGRRSIDPVVLFKIKLLAKLSRAVKIADARNQRKAERKTFSAIAVALREDRKSFDKADRMFNKDALL